MNMLNSFCPCTILVGVDGIFIKTFSLLDTVYCRQETTPKTDQKTMKRKKAANTASSEMSPMLSFSMLDSEFDFKVNDIFFSELKYCTLNQKCAPSVRIVFKKKNCLLICLLSKGFGTLLF